MERIYDSENSNTDGCVPRECKGCLGIGIVSDGVGREELETRAVQSEHQTDSIKEVYKTRCTTSRRVGYRNGAPKKTSVSHTVPSLTGVAESHGGIQSEA